MGIDSTRSSLLTVCAMRVRFVGFYGLKAMTLPVMIAVAVAFVLDLVVAVVVDVLLHIEYTVNSL